ncbi:MAG: PAS domain-containing protein [Candidatus Thermoplasmatota archaeon]
MNMESIEIKDANILLSNEKYKLIFENSAVAITVADDKERITDWNQYTERLLGMTKDDLYLKPVSSLYPAEEWERMRTQNIRQKGMQHHFETRMIRKNNEIINVDLSLSMIKNQQGKIIGSIGVIKDITDQKIMEKALAYEHNRLKTLLDNIPDSIYFKDEQNKFILVNKAKAEHWHTTPEQMIGKTDYDFLPKEEAEKTYNDDNHILQTGEPIIDKIEKITGADGTERWVSVTKIPRRDKEGKIIGTMGISRDVTKWVKNIDDIKSK